jgi:fructose-specific phosphotransferase system IIC component
VRIPARLAPLMFGALLSAIMVAVVSAFVLATTRGLHAGFVADWLRSCVTTWPVAFPIVTLVAPWVRRIVTGFTERPGVA